MDKNSTTQPVILSATSATEFLRALIKERDASRARTQALNAQIAAVEKAQRTGEPATLDNAAAGG